MSELTKEFLYKRYVEEQKTAVDIGNEVDLRPANVIAQLRRVGIPVRSRGDAIRLRKMRDVDPEELKRLYSTEGQSPRAIAEKMGTTRGRVLSQLRRMGIYEVSRTYQGEKHWHHGAKLAEEHVNKIMESRRRNGSHTGPDPVPPKEKFWQHVEKTETCWNWKNATAGITYGRIYDAHTRRSILAHRFSWELHYGPVPRGLLVLHKCDNPTCVNPEHLFLGTQSENMSDKVDKGRGRWKVLDLATVMYIRESYAAGKYSSIELAQMFNVSKATVFNIVSGRSYKSTSDGVFSDTR